MPAVVLKKESVTVPDVSVPDSSATASGHFKKAILAEHSWLKQAIKLIAQNGETVYPGLPIMLLIVMSDFFPNPYSTDASFL